MIAKAGIILTKVDLFPSDTLKEGERRESLWAGGNVYACILIPQVSLVPFLLLAQLACWVLSQDS